MEGFSISPISASDFAAAKVHRDTGFTPDKVTSIKFTRLLLKRDIEGVETRESYFPPIQHMLFPQPYIAYLRSSTYKERRIAFDVTRECARTLKIAFECMQLNRSVPLKVKAELLDPSVPIDDRLDGAIFTYLNGQQSDLADAKVWKSTASALHLDNVAGVIVGALSAGYSTPHIPAGKLFVRMLRDSAGVVTMIEAPETSPAPSTSADAPQKKTGTIIAVPVALIRPMRIPITPGLQCDWSDVFESPMIAIIGDVIFAPFDSNMCNIAFIHMYARAYALYIGIRFVRTIVTLDVATNIVMSFSYF